MSNHQIHKHLRSRPVSLVMFGLDVHNLKGNVSELKNAAIAIKDAAGSMKDAAHSGVDAVKYAGS